VQNYTLSSVNQAVVYPQGKTVDNPINNVSGGTNKGKIELGRKDSFAKPNNQDKSNNGKFDISECINNFAKGVISPISAIIKHPLMTVGVVGATAALCTLIPVMGPILGVGFGALSVFQIGKGVTDIVKNYKNGEYDKAEASFNEVGQGTVGVAMSALGLKQNARVAKEAKLMSKLGVSSLNKAQKEAIALEVKNGSTLDAAKEVGSLFMSKAGLKAVGAQFKPSNIATRAKEAFNFLFKREEVTKVKKEKMKFTDTTEGKRRAAMTREQVEAEGKALYKEVCDEYGIPEELRPKFEVYCDEGNLARGGGYDPLEHKIKINEAAYKEGYFDLPDIVKHETTHAKEAILRQRLPMEEKEKIVVEYLLDKIQNGDKQKVLTGEANIITGSVKVEPPKMNPKMKADFSSLAKDKLYQITDYTNDDFTAMVKPLVESNPDFVKGYDNIDDAVNAMVNYAKNHNFRFKIAMKEGAGFNTSGVDTSFLKELSQEERVAAIESFKTGIDCLESNAANQSGLFGLGGDFAQYEFTPEEVMCQQRGNNFEISKLEAQLAKLRSQKDFDMAEEARLLDQIKRRKLTIEYKTKGREMYRLQTESFNHPENTELADKVKAMESELRGLKKQINSIQGDLSWDEISALCSRGKTEAEVIELAKHNPTFEYSTYQAKVRPETGATLNIPYSVTTAADIIGDNNQNRG